MPNPNVSAARRQGIADLLARTAKRRPAHRALVWDGGVDTFADLDRLVTRVAHAMADRGVGKGDRIVIFAHNSRDYLVYYFAMARLGAISVPANFMLNADELAYILDHSQPVGYIVEDELADTLASAWNTALPDRKPRFRALDHEQHRPRATRDTRRHRRPRRRRPRRRDHG